MNSAPSRRMFTDAALSLAKKSVSKWTADRAPTLAASLALYTILSLAPLLVIAVSVAGLIFGGEAARGELTHQFDTLVGSDGSAAVQSMLANASKKSSGITGAIVGLLILFFGASGIFIELQDSLNSIWGVKPKPGSGILKMIRQRLFSFAMVLGVGFLLLVSLIVSAVLGALGGFFQAHLPGGEVLWSVVNLVISLAVTTGLFALIYKLVPDTRIAWKDVWVGAAITATLFTIGKTLIGLYLGHAAVGSAFGAAGSLVVLVVWIYYSAQILLLGAEFTRVYTDHHGSRSASSASDAPAESSGPTKDEPKQEEIIPAAVAAKRALELKRG